MRICVLVKRVPIPGGRIPVTDDGQAVDTAMLGFTISPHEECAVEAAVRLVEAGGGDVTVLSLGPPEAEDQLRYAISLGAQRGALVPTDGTDHDPQRTAAALQTAVAGIENRDGSFDLVLVGNESADAGGFQVGVRLAHALGRPVVNGVKGLVADGDHVRLERPTGTATEIYRLPLPAVVGVREGLNLPRYPTMRGRLASRRAEVEQIDATAPPGGQSLVRLVPQAEEVTDTEVLGTGADAAPRVLEVLRALKVLA